MRSTGSANRLPQTTRAKALTPGESAEIRFETMLPAPHDAAAPISRIEPRQGHLAADVKGDIADPGESQDGAGELPPGRPLAEQGDRQAKGEEHLQLQDKRR